MKRQIPKHMCSECGERRAIFIYNGKVRADKSHDLCIRCYNDIINANNQLDKEHIKKGAR
jgi:hypothetical protein